MADNVREVLRAAQAAEMGGDKPRAISLLQQAADLCRRTGNGTRAEQLLRYALRLDPSRADLEAELARLEAMALSSPPTPDEDSTALAVNEDTEALQEALREAERSVERRSHPMAVAVEAMHSAAAAPRVSEPRKDEGPPPEGEGAFIERGPTRADPSLDAWCSFCCRPRAEVGPLVAGPAGAFICTACVGESGTLLGGVGLVAPSPRERASAQRPVSVDLVGQEAAREQLESGLGAGVRRVLLLGPEGCGKSTWVRMLVEQGRGVLVTPEALDEAPVNAPLLVEDVDRLPSPAQLLVSAFLTRHPSRTVLMTTRGSPVASGLVLLSDSGRLPVPTTASLAEATREAVPRGLLEQVQLLVPLEAPGVEDLCEIARRRLASREDGQLSGEALTALAREAARSPRLGHELEALLARVPPGAWRLETKKKPGKSKPARRSRRKGSS